MRFFVRLQVYKFINTVELAGCASWQIIINFIIILDNKNLDTPFTMSNFGKESQNLNMHILNFNIIKTG